jgi:beta-N-acetylhexosaminidase
MKNYAFKLFFLGCCAFIFGCAAKKTPPVTAKVPPPSIPIIAETIVDIYAESYDSDSQRKWVDSVYNQLSFDEKIGQLFMIAAYSNKDSAHIKSIDRLITENKVGGLIFFQGGPGRQARLTNRYQSKSKLPLFIAVDAEWGLSMRLDSTYRYPWNMTLGAIQNKKLIERVGINMAKRANAWAFTSILHQCSILIPIRKTLL